MSQIPVTYIDIRFFVHATEDLDRVVDAVQRVLPGDYTEDIVFRRNNLRGHYGNPITLFAARIKKRELISAFVDNLSSRLDELEKGTLHREINSHVEKGSLYVRLDKQAALQGQLRFCTADPIRVRIRFRKTKNEDVVKICQELGMLT